MWCKKRRGITYMVRIYCFQCKKESNPGLLGNLSCKECCKAYVLLNYLKKLKITEENADKEYTKRERLYE